MYRMPLAISGICRDGWLVGPRAGNQEDPFKGQKAGHAFRPDLADPLLRDLVIGGQSGDGDPMLPHQAANHRTGQDVVAVHQGRSAMG